MNQIGKGSRRHYSAMFMTRGFLSNDSNAGRHKVSKHDNGLVSE